jgi:hypothetical protein
LHDATTNASSELALIWTGKIVIYDTIQALGAANTTSNKVNYVDNWKPLTLCSSLEAAQTTQKLAGFGFLRLELWMTSKELPSSVAVIGSPGRDLCPLDLVLAAQAKSDSLSVSSTIQSSFGSTAAAVSSGIEYA